MVGVIARATTKCRSSPRVGVIARATARYRTSPRVEVIARATARLGLLLGWEVLNFSYGGSNC